MTTPTVAVYDKATVTEALADSLFNHPTQDLFTDLAERLNSYGGQVSTEQLAEALIDSVLAADDSNLAAKTAENYANGIVRLLVAEHDKDGTLAKVMKAAAGHAVQRVAVEEALSNFPEGRGTPLATVSETEYQARLAFRSSKEWRTEIAGFAGQFISLVKRGGLTPETLVDRVREFLRSEVFPESPAPSRSSKKRKQGSELVDRFCLHTNALSFVFAEDQQSDVQPLLFAVGTERQTELELAFRVRAADESLVRQTGRPEPVTR